MSFTQIIALSVLVSIFVSIPVFLYLKYTLPENQIKRAIPKGFYLGFVPVYHPQYGEEIWAKDPVLVKLDPKTHNSEQTVGYIFPGYWEPAVYKNGIKGKEIVLPLTPEYIKSLHPDIVEEFINNIPAAKAALDDLREEIPFLYPHPYPQRIADRN